MRETMGMMCRNLIMRPDVFELSSSRRVLRLITRLRLLQQYVPLYSLPASIINWPIMQLLTAGQAAVVLVNSIKYYDITNRMDGRTDCKAD